MFKRIFILFSGIPLYFILTVLTHEIGHAVTGKAVGLGTPIIHVWPGIQLYPDFGATLSSDDLHKRFVASVSFLPESKNLMLDFPKQHEFWNLTPTIKLSSKRPHHEDSSSSFVGFMGSGTTYFFSVVCIIFLLMFKPKGVLRNLIVLGSFLFYDILCYTVLPVFFGAPHLIVIGSNEPEPINAMVAMGIPFDVSVTLVIALCLIQVCVLVRIAKKERLFHV